MWLNKSIRWSSFVGYLFFLQKKFNIPYILFITFSCIGSQNILSSNTHPRYVTCECYFIFIWLYLIFNWRTFFDLRLFAKRIDLVFSSQKCELNLLSTNQSQIFSKSLLGCFSISSTSLCWCKMHEFSAYETKVDLTACGISFTKIKNKRQLKIDHYGTTQKISPKSESLLSILTRSIHSER